MGNIKQVTTKHRKIMESMVLDGLTPREVSQLHAITEARLSIIRKSPLWVMEERELRKEHLHNHQKRMNSLVPKAIDALEDAVISSDPKAKISAAKEILNRGGMPANIVISDEPTDNVDMMYETLKDIGEQKEALLSELGVNSVEDLIDDNEEDFHD